MLLPIRSLKTTVVGFLLLWLLRFSLVLKKSAKKKIPQETIYLHVFHFITTYTTNKVVIKVSIVGPPKWDIFRSILEEVSGKLISDNSGFLILNKKFIIFSSFIRFACFGISLFIPTFEATD